MTSGAGPGAGEVTPPSRGSSLAEGLPGTAVRRLAPWLALALAVAVEVQWALRYAGYNWKAHNGDQNSYLRLALRIREGEGFANGNYHPLVSLLFSPWASRDWSFFTQAKLVNIAVGAAVLVVVFALGRRLFGSSAALVATAALAVNTAFYSRSARTEPEVLLTGLVFAAWFCWVWSLEHPRWGLAAGALAGLAYMAKGTGQFLIVGMLTLPLLRYGPRGWWSRRRGLALTVAAYVLAASPLLITNWQSFGSPFYAFPSAHAMWYDGWGDRLGSPDGRHITLRTYLVSHTPADVVERVVDGVQEVPPEWLDAFPVSLPDGAGWLVAAAVALALAGTAWRRHAGEPATASRHPPEPDLATLGHRLRDATWTLALLGGPMFLYFVWYAPIANSSRFVLPLVPALYLWLAGALVYALRRWLPGLTAASWPPVLVSLAVAALALLALGQGEWRTPAAIAASDQAENAKAIALTGYLGRTAPPGGETVVWGPGDLASWSLHGRVTFRPILESTTDFTALEAYLAEVGAVRIVLAPEMVRKRDTALAPFFRLEDGAVRWSELPPGWRMAWRTPEDGCDYCVFEVTPGR